MNLTAFFVFSYSIIILLDVPQATGERMPSDVSTRFLIFYMKSLIKPDRSYSCDATRSFYGDIVKDLGGMYTAAQCQNEMKRLKEDIMKFDNGKPCKLSEIQKKLMRVAKDTSENAYVQNEKRTEIEKVLQEVETELNDADSNFFRSLEPCVHRPQEIICNRNGRMPNRLVTKLLVHYLKEAINPCRKIGAYGKPSFYQIVANGVGENYTNKQCQNEMQHLRRDFRSIQAGNPCTTLSDIQKKLLAIATKVQPNYYVDDCEIRKEIEKVLEEESKLRNKACTETLKRPGPSFDQQENKRPRCERMPRDEAIDILVIYLRAATKPGKLHELHSKGTTFYENAVAYLGGRYTVQQCQLEMELLKQDLEDLQAGDSHASSNIQIKLIELYIKVSSETYVLDTETEQEINEALQKVTALRMNSMIQDSESSES